MTLFNRKTLSVAIAFSLMNISSTIAAPLQQSTTAVSAANPISFSFALTPLDTLSLKPQTVETVSDEYWFTVSGKQLNAGVAVHTTVPGALIKISRQADTDQALNGKFLSLYSATAPQLNLAEHIINEEDLGASGVFANTSAIKLDKQIKPGKLSLKYTAALASDSQFVIHVKEKNSKQRLSLSTAKQHYLQGEAVTFDAKMLNAQQALDMKSISAFVKAPSGKTTTVAVSVDAKGVTHLAATQLNQAQHTVEAPINGLYELHFSGMANFNGQQVIRTGKLAFAFSDTTAKLQQQKIQTITSAAPQTQFDLMVNEPGRYEIRAIVYGQTEQGLSKPIMETHSAQNLEAGAQSITMHFDQKLLQQSTLKAPFVVKQVRLYDQTRMSQLSL
jgi:hypothetical protein